MGAEPIPAMYDDSTHQLWRCDTDAGQMMLKVCSDDNVQQSDFWQVMHRLFGVNLSDDLAAFKQVQQQMTNHSLFAVPELIACAGKTDTTPAFILSRFIHGDMLLKQHVTDAMVKQLAEHIAGLHLQQQPNWGKLYQADKSASLWPDYLIKTLVTTCQQRHIGEPWFSRAIAQIEHIQPHSFSPIMTDLRWDQFIFEADKITALVDLDAFVIGPRELELVLLEYLLTAHQAVLFKTAYEKFLPLPDLSNHRLSYRLLLFLMNVLGEIDLDKWMRSLAKW